MLQEGQELVPGYRLEKFLGRGQFGEVWRTTAPGGTSAALKFIDLHGRQGLKEFRGIQRVKEIRHANLMPITALWLLDDNGNILGDHILESFNTEPAAPGPPPSPRSTLVADPGSIPEAPAPTPEESIRGTVRDVGKPRWLVVGMLLADESLEDRLAGCKAAGEEGIEVKDLLRYMEEAAKGIDFMNAASHNLGDGLVAIQHCDIKPANIMLVGGSAVICDFGLAQVLSNLNVAVTATSMLGSPAFMAPECIDRKPSSATDQYSLAVSYCELRTGELPFEDQSYGAVLRAHQTASLDLNRMSPAEQEVIRKATATDPADRYESSQEMVAALRRAVFPEASRSSRGSKILAAALMLVAVALMAYMSWVLIFGGGKDPPKYFVQVDPAKAIVTVDDTSTKPEDGKVAIAFDKGQKRTIEVTHSGYESVRRQLTREDFTEFELKVTLVRVSTLIDEAYDFLAQGKSSEALKQLVRAARADPSVAMQTPSGTQINLFGDRKDVGAAERGLVLPDGRVILFNYRNMWEVRRTESDSRKWEVNRFLDQNQLKPEGPDILDGAVDSEGKLLAVAVGEEVQLFDVSRSPRSPSRKLACDGAVSKVLVSPDSRWVIAVVDSVKTEVLFWPRASASDNFPPEPKFRIAAGGSVLQRLCDSKSKWLVICEEHKAWSVDLQAPDPTKTVESFRDLDQMPMIKSAAVGNGRLLLGDTAGNVECFDLASRKLAFEWKPHEAPDDKGVIPSIEVLHVIDDRYCLTGAAEVNSACLWRYDGGQPTGVEKTIQHDATVSGLANTKSGRRLISGSLDKSVKFVGRSPASPPALVIDLKNEGVSWMGVTPDEQWLLVAGEEGGLRVYEIAKFELLQEVARELARTPN